MAYLQQKNYSRLFLPILALTVLTLAAASGNALSWQDANTAVKTSTTATEQQQANPAPGPTDVFKVKSRLVVVDVVVRDKKGAVVTDLKKENFKVTENSKEQPISVFSFQRPGEGEAPPPQNAKLPPNVFKNRAKYQPNRALNVMLIDALNCTLLNQAYVRSEMVKFLEKLPEGQPIAIFAMGKKLQMLQDFTTDLTDLKRVIHTFKGEGSPVLSSPAGTPETPMVLTGWAEQLAFEKDPALLIQVNDFAQEAGSGQIDFRIQYTMAALNSLARMLSGYPGRKNLIWITESVPLNIFPDIKSVGFSASNQALRLGQSGDHQLDREQRAAIQKEQRTNAQNGRNYSDQLALIGNLLADAQIAVYPVDARGLVGPAFTNVANNVSGQGAIGGLVNRIEGKQAEELFEAHYNMLDIAEKTGGLAFYNRNDLDVAVRDGIDDGATYYTLGYYPENKTWNGQFRKIHVAVDVSGAKVRHRDGYFAIDRMAYAKQHPGQHDYDFSMALNSNYPVSTSLPFEATVLAPGQSGDNKVRINFALNSQQITFERTAEGLQSAQVDCAARAFSPKNGDHPVKTEAGRMDAKLNLEQFDKISKSFLPCQLSLDLPPGLYLLRLAVRDNLSGTLGSLNASVLVPENVTAEKGPGTQSQPH